MSYGRASSQARVSQAQALPAPVGGIDDISPLAAMDPQFCLQLNNWYPQTGYLALRRGYREYATGLPDIKVLAPFNKTDGTQELFAFTDSGVYNVTSGGDLSAATPVFVITEGLVKFTQFSNIAGQFLVCCNGVDPAFIYNGTTWESMSVTGGDPTTFTMPLAYKNRLWFIQEESMTAYYMGIDAIAGDAKPFFFGGIFNNGGALIYLATWSYDGGAGLDDKLVIATTAGEIAIYSGNDPDQADAWQLEAVFFVSAPMGFRTTCELGGDVLMLTRTGVIPLSKVVQGISTSALYEESLSKRISRTLNRLANTIEFLGDWQLVNVPLLQAVVVVIPETSGNPAQQYVMNILTGAWCRFDLPVECTAIFRRNLYFGTVDGRVCAMTTGHLDDVKLDGSGGNPIQASLFSAYNYLGDNTTNKHFKLIRPIFQSSQPPSYLVRINTDYDTTSLAGNPVAPGGTAEDPIWDTSLWDQAVWSSEGTVYRPWVGLVGIGFCAAVLIKIAGVDFTTLAAMEVVYEPGGVV